MNQDIDFLKFSSGKQKQLPAKWITFSAASLFVFFMLITLIMILFQLKDTWTLKYIRSENTKAIATFQQIAKTHPLLAGNTTLVNQIKSFKLSLKKDQAYYETLTRTALRYGFSNYMKALVEAVPEGLWLNEIEINQVTKHISLGGYMLQPVAVSSFLDALQKIAPFSKTKFNLFDVKAVSGQSVIEFKLTNTKVNLNEQKK
ncbi:MAG: PilN domain-containing protein [Legionella sp.]|nr:PilN domain-containing protein [Legionella sp.]